jgi:hypothetical protein
VLTLGIDQLDTFPAEHIDDAIPNGTADVPMPALLAH